MTDLLSARLHFPFLAAGQAQKELTHNEALALADIMISPAIENADSMTPPPNPVAGQSWLVADEASGAWAGQSGRIAAFTAGGWRFITPFEGLVLWDRALAKQRRFHNGQWVTPNNLALPAGGSVIDQEARAAIENIAALLDNWGLT